MSPSHIFRGFIRICHFFVDFFVIFVFICHSVACFLFLFRWAHIRALFYQLVNKFQTHSRNRNENRNSLTRIKSDIYSDISKSCAAVSKPKAIQVICYFMQQQRKNNAFLISFGNQNIDSSQCANGFVIVCVISSQFAMFANELVFQKRTHNINRIMPHRRHTNMKI